MIRSRFRQPDLTRTALGSIAAVLFVLLAFTGSGLAAQASTEVQAGTKIVRYHGVTLKVPAGWPVFHLGSHPTTCVRFNRHAVYLGRPGGNQSCPVQAMGRTEAILVSPASYHGRLLTPVSRLRAATATGSMARITDSTRHLVITATWGNDPAAIRRALGLRSARALRTAMLATNGHRPRAATATNATGAVDAIKANRGGHELPHLTSSATPAEPGEVYTGLGFDICSAPSTSAMAVWGESSPYAAIGIYIGGVNAACLGGNLNATWVSAESAAGWHMLPLYVGLQAPGGCCQAMSTAQTGGQFTTAASQGTAAAQDAVAQAQALGVGTGNPIYYDMENYRRSTTNSGAVLAFLQAWTEQLHTSGYLSGVYSSGSSGITDLVTNYGTTYVEPDELWTASWYSSAPPTSPANAYVPSTDWPGAHQLLQYWSDATNENYGGVKLEVDRDYVEAPTAAYGSGSFVTQVASTPTITVRPQADGSVNLTPRWTGAVGVTGYTILGGSSPTALAPLVTVAAGAKLPVKLHGVYSYFEVQATNSLGETIGTSPPAAAPASVAIFGHSAYVGSRGPVGIPVACLHASPCQLQAAIHDGRRLLVKSPIRTIPRHGGQLLVPLTPQIHRLVASATGHRLPVTVTVTSGGGASATRPLRLVPYTIAGDAPAHHSWASATLQIIGQRSFVSNAWTGGLLAACKSSTPCVATTRVTLAGDALAEPRTVTLGPGEIGYLTYRLNNRGHLLLRAKTSNQLGARVRVTTAASSSTGAAAATVAGTKTAMALVSLDSFR